MNVNAILLPAETLLDAAPSDAPVQPANVQGSEFAALLLLIFAAAAPRQHAFDAGASPLPAGSEELNAAPQISRAAQVPGSKAAAIDPAAGETLDQLNPASEKSLEHARTTFASEMGISRSTAPSPDGRELEEVPAAPAVGTEDNRTLDSGPHSRRSSSKIPPTAPDSFESTVLINGQGARAGQPQQVLFGNDSETTPITSLPQSGNSHDAAQEDRQANPKDPFFVVQGEGPKGDPARMRRDLGMASVTVERSGFLNSKNATDLFQPGRNDQFLQGRMMQHNVSAPNLYPGNAPAHGVSPTRAETAQSFESSGVDVEIDLNSQELVRGSASVNSSPATDVRNEKHNSSYPQNPRSEPAEIFQIGSERSEGGRDTGAVHFMHTTDQVAAASAREPQDRSWHPVIDRVASEISGRIHIGKQEAVLQLDPVELGKVQIDLHMEGDKLAARILAETPESRALIEAHLPELRQALVENRVELVEISIDSGSWGGQRGEGQKPQQEGGAWLQTARASSEVRPGDAEEHERARPASLRLDAGRVSMWA